MSLPLAATSRALAVPELLLEILSRLCQADRIGAARVSKRWRARSEVVLYRAINLIGGFSGRGEGWARVSERVGLLLRTLAGAPELGQRVAELRLITGQCAPPGHAYLALWERFGGNYQAFGVVQLLDCAYRCRFVGAAGKAPTLTSTRFL